MQQEITSSGIGSIAPAWEGTKTGEIPIENLQVGDRVLSRNEFDPNGEVDEKIVEDVFVRSAPILNVVVRGRVIRTTSEHPFWVDGKGWTAAGELKAGDQLLGADKSKLPVESVSETEDTETVYNFRVADWHTYFVGDKGWDFEIWVHNACSPGLGGQNQNPIQTGSFSIWDWTGYPAGLPKPKGPFRLLNGTEYEAARKAANEANAALRRAAPEKYLGLQIHEIHPVKFGGNPIDPLNKIALPFTEHHPFTSWWKRLQDLIE